jgi:hypothetical protein
MAKFETVPIGELKHRLPAKLLPLVEDYRDKLGKLSAEQGGRLTLEKGDDAKEPRGALKAAEGTLKPSDSVPVSRRGRSGELLSGEVPRLEAGEFEGRGSGYRQAER